MSVTIVRIKYDGTEVKLSLDADDKRELIAKLLAGCDDIVITGLGVY